LLNRRMPAASQGRDGILAKGRARIEVLLASEILSRGPFNGRMPVAGKNGFAGECWDRAERESRCGGQDADGCYCGTPGRLGGVNRGAPLVHCSVLRYLSASIRSYYWISKALILKQPHVFVNFDLFSRAMWLWLSGDGLPVIFC